MKRTHCRFLYGHIKRYSSSDTTSILTTREIQPSYDAVVIGGGHNGLVAAAYLAKAGKQVAVLERRHVLGGAAVTEEIVPGFKFSRASYLLSLLRPVVVKELELKKHGLKIYLRDPNSFTPLYNSKDYLLLGSDNELNKKEVAKFSHKDAQVFANYETWLERLANSLDPLLDNVPVNLSHIYSSSWKERWSTIKPILAFGKMLSTLKEDLPSFYDIVMTPASTINILDRWFESDALRATLAIDAVVGAMLSPHSVGSGYVLLHHVMGELEGKRNAWGYVEGGMGAVSAAIARSALSYGANLFTEKPVKQVLVEGNKTCGVLLEDGTVIESKIILSNATPKITFLDLLPQGTLSESFYQLISSIDYTSPVTKINVALKGLPKFIASPEGSPTAGSPGPHHQCTIHLNSETIEKIHTAYLDAQQGQWSRKPLIEMCLPSSLDPTLAPPGCHVVSLFTQYTPYTIYGHTDVGHWTDTARDEYTNLVFDAIEEYAPGFRQLIVGWETLTPPDLERVFGLTGGNVFHGAMSLDQLYVSRPTYKNPTYMSPVNGLFLCGSGAHPGGGVMGASGRLAAQIALKRGF